MHIRDLEEVSHVWGEVFQAEGMVWIKMQRASAHRDVLAQGQRRMQGGAARGTLRKASWWVAWA